MNKEIERGVEKYYSDKIRKHGATSLGVDWNSKDSQYLRFEQLSKVIDQTDLQSILDFGCGYGEYLAFLEDRKLFNTNISYWGYDISELMIKKAKERYDTQSNVTFSSSLPELEVDYLIASGLFNVKLDLCSDEDWVSYIKDTLFIYDKMSSKGFSFNALTKYSDKEFMKDYLFYSDPLELFDFCKLNFSNNVALLHDYDLYEFTIIVRK